ncbi:MAG: hypothetical protein ACIAXF_16300 [Phycisphaerales bacterium JB063]
MPSIARKLLSCALPALIAWAVLAVSPAHGQILRGEWVDRSQQSIDEHRKTQVVVVVLNENDRPIQGAQVHLEQVRHDFVLGIAVGDAGPPTGDAGELPVWRCFNALALDRLTDWLIDPPTPAQEVDAAAEQWHDWLDPVEVSYGPVLSADAARIPERVLSLDTSPLRSAVHERVGRALQVSDRVDRFDLYADLTGHALLEDRLGAGILNMLYDTAGARRPDAAICLRVRDGLDTRRSAQLRQRMRALGVRQVHFDAVTIDQSFPGTVNAPSLERILNDRIAPLDTRITIANLNVAGSSDVAAAINLETVLRLLFATPNIHGIYLAGMAGDDLAEPASALIDQAGEPAACGQVVEGLFRGLWWTDLTLPSDDIGNARADVFAGRYRITATLPDGRVLETEAHLPRSDEPRYIVLQAGPGE